MTETNSQLLLQDYRDTFKLLREPALAIWAIYILLVPVYIFPSGLPQPGDWALVVFAPLMLGRWMRKIPAYMRPTTRSLYMFTGYVIIANLVWSLALNVWSINLRYGFVLSPFFYAYNTLAFVVIVVMHHRYGERFLWFTSKMVLLSLIGQGGASFFFSTGGTRETVLFDNPNQLGYYALISVSLLMLLQRKKYVTTLEVTIGTIVASYLALISASKAALGAIGILIIAGALVRFRTMLFIASVFLVSLYVPNPMQDALDRTLNRFDHDTSLGFVEERGYDRIWNFPEYWVVGAGEGGFMRFSKDTAIKAHEIHSSIGTLFFSYGIVGTFLFAVFLAMVLRGKGIRTTMLVLPTMAYGMTHQGLRATLFWVLLAIVAVFGRTKPPNR